MNQIFSSQSKSHLQSVEKSERDLQEHLKENWNKIFPHLTFIKDEYPLSGAVRRRDQNGRIDILGFNKKTKKFVVVELKKGFDSNIRGQANDYRDFIEDNFLEIYIHVKEELNADIPQRSKIIQDDIELILVAKEFAEKDIVRAKKMDNITCIKYEWFQSKDDLFLLYNFQNNAPGKSNVKASTTITTTKKGAITLDVHRNKASEEFKPIMDKFRKAVLSLGNDVNEGYLPEYVKYVVKTSFLCYHVRKNWLVLQLRIDKKSFKDPKKISKDISNRGWSVTREIKFDKNSNIEEVMKLVKQAYDYQ